MMVMIYESAAHIDTQFTLLKLEEYVNHTVMWEDGDDDDQAFVSPSFHFSTYIICYDYYYETELHV